MGILGARKPSHTIILPTWHGGNRYSTLEHAASRAKHHGGHISPVRLRRKHCCYFSREEKDGAHLLTGSSGIYRLSVFPANERHSEFGSDLPQPAPWGKRAPSSAGQLRASEGNLPGKPTPPSPDAVEGDSSVRWLRRQQRKPRSERLPNRRVPLHAAGQGGGSRARAHYTPDEQLHQGIWKFTTPSEQACGSSPATSPPQHQGQDCDWGVKDLLLSPWEELCSNALLAAHRKFTRGLACYTDE